MGLRADLFEAERDGGNFLNAVRLREDMVGQLRRSKEMRNLAQVASAYAELGEVEAAKRYLAEANAIAGTPSSNASADPGWGSACKPRISNTRGGTCSGWKENSRKLPKPIAAP